MKLAELKAVAEELKIESADKLKKQELIFKIIDEQRVREQGASETTDTQITETNAATEAAPAAKQRRERVKKSPENKAQDEVANTPNLFDPAAEATSEVRVVAEPSMGFVSNKPKSDEANPNQGDAAGPRENREHRDNREPRELRDNRGDNIEHR
ncbi:MAG: Rho termination factor N-terminal domain-containing protein, partial [Flavobacteriales bacterium]